MSLVLPRPPHNCGTPGKWVSQDTLFCPKCKQKFTSPPQPTPEDLRRAIELNNRKRLYHVYYGIDQHLQDELESIAAEIRELEQLRTKMLEANKQSAQVQTECDQNQLDLQKQLEAVQLQSLAKKSDLEELRSGQPRTTTTTTSKPKLSEDFITRAMEKLACSREQVLDMLG